MNRSLATHTKEWSVQLKEKTGIPVKHSYARLYSSTHKRHTQVEYQFMYAPGLHSTLFSMYCATPSAYIN